MKNTTLAPSAWITQFTSDLKGTAGASLSHLRFAVKDNIDVEGYVTTAACPDFAFSPKAHATVVQKLLSAGASLAGKTNLDQFACGLNGTRSPYGAVPNSFNPDFVSGGSSAGSAYVVATGQVDFSLGTDTAGSGRIPAGLNNIVGMKPSKGLISAYGVVPAAQNVDCVSIFARTVDVAAQVLKACMAHDPQDPFSRILPMRHTAFPSNFKFGVPSHLNFEGDSLAQEAFDRSVANLEKLGGERVVIDMTAHFEAAIMLYESALVAQRYAAIQPFFDAHPEAVIEPVRSIIAKGKNYSAADYCKAEVEMMALSQKALAAWLEVDVLAVPTAPTHYTIEAMLADPINLNRNLGQYTNFVNLFDYAALAVPSEIRADGLPFGVTLIAPAGSDWQLLELGQRYHHATGLLQGATSLALPSPQPIAALQAPTTVRIAVVGAHLTGMPLNYQLIERQASLIKAMQTAPDYRLFALPNSTPPKPGLLRVEEGQGAAIAVEIWEMPVSHFGSFVTLIPPPLGIGTLRLEDGANVQGFICEHQALTHATDITALGGWRAYIQTLAEPAR